MLMRMSWEGRMELTKEQKAAAGAEYKLEFRGYRDFMKEQGFVVWSTGGFLRINELDVMEYVGIQKDYYGRKFFTVTIAMLPLCNPVDFFHIGFGKRLPAFFTPDWDPWYDYLSPEAVKHSFGEVKEQLAQYAFPWFLSFRSPEATEAQLNPLAGMYWAIRQDRPDWLEKRMAQYNGWLQKNNLTMEQALTATSGGTDKDARAVKRLIEECERLGAKEFALQRERETAQLYKLPKKLLSRYV